MIEKEDWRLQDQQRYLTGAILFWQAWGPPKDRPEWDHDHCAFCWQKFMDGDDAEVQKEGYATEDGRYWVCKRCFEDFSELFRWTIATQS